MVQLAHRPSIQGVKCLPRDAVYVGILFSLHLCERAVLGETSVCQLIVAQLETRQDPSAKLAHILCGHDWRMCAHAPRPFGRFAICMLALANLSTLPGSLVQLLFACPC